MRHVHAMRNRIAPYSGAGSFPGCFRQVKSVPGASSVYSIGNAVMPISPCFTTPLLDLIELAHA